MNKLYLTVLVAMVVILSIPLRARAIDVQLTLDQPRVVASMVGGVDSFNVAAMSNRSVCCSVSAQNTKDAHFASLAGGAPYFLTNRGKDTPPVNSNFTDSAIGRQSRVCFMTSADVAPASTIISLFVGFNSAGTGTGTNVTGFCQQTSLVGGYNTSVTDFNFLEITVANNFNTDGRFSLDSSTVEGVIMLRDALNGTSLTSPFTITTNPSDGLGRKDVNIHLLVGNKSFGPIVLNHNAPPGTVTARLVQYNLISSVPFKFEPVLEQQFTPIGAK